MWANHRRVCYTGPSVVCWIGFKEATTWNNNCSCALADSIVSLGLPLTSPTSFQSITSTPPPLLYDVEDGVLCCSFALALHRRVFPMGAPQFPGGAPSVTLHSHFMRQVVFAANQIAPRFKPAVSCFFLLVVVTAKWIP